MRNNKPWIDVYRPQKIDDCVLPDHLTNQFKAFLREETIPNLILSGPSGVGKTTVAYALLKEYGCDYIKINASLKRGIDIIKDEVLQFASSSSMIDNKKKYIIFDEADGLTSIAQESLKSFIEEFSDNCGFIFTCNNISKIDVAIQSRCQIIHFNLLNSDFLPLIKEFYVKLEKIFEENDVTVDKKTVGLVIKKYYPDWRKTIIILQNYSLLNNTIDVGILSNKEEESDLYVSLIEYLKNKKWNDIRKWVGENFYITSDFITFYKRLTKQLEPLIYNTSLPILCIRSNEFDVQNTLSIDKETNVIAYLTRIMSEVIFK
jgi:DNA polymerase III delta prime subunit